MFNRSQFILMMFACLIFIMPMQLYAQDEKIDLTIRLGEGGFNDNRSPVGSLGGDQLAIDIKLKKLPYAINISSEYYTNSPEPTHSYEISNMTSLNLLYISQFFDFKSTDYFFGGGFGVLTVPRGEEYPGKSIKSNVYSLEAGVNIKYFEHIGFYTMTKYIEAEKTVQSTNVIDYHHFIILLGISFNLSL